MKRINKSIIFILIAATVFLILSSCSNNAKNNVPSTTEANKGTDAVTQNTELTDNSEIPAPPNGGPLYPVGTDYYFYTEGEEEENGSVFKINKDFKVTFFNTKFPGLFNRFSIVYNSESPLKISVAFSKKGETKVDDYFLEAGNNIKFRGLISSYLDRGEADSIESITFNTLDGKTSAFSISEFSCDRINVYSAKSYFLSNDRFKIGIRLSWGGGINYIEDKNCTVPDLVNLINSNDTGRLVQQSYYGTYSNDEYTAADYNNNVWPYNPVQGGDRFGHASRLIDLEITENSVYIKAQPQDWAQDNKITPSYMENTYTLCDDHILVNNRFVDFSGWTHRFAHQELPAFYVVSYLDKFVWYNGSKGWTGDELTERDDLPFWGDPQYTLSCRFPFRESNTETWCAWISSESDFGIGIYVPNIDMLLAGRHNYTGTKASEAGPTNYVAPLMTIKLVSFVPIEYSYVITTGSEEQIRNTFYNNKEFTSNDSLRNSYQSMRIKDDQ